MIYGQLALRRCAPSASGVQSQVRYAATLKEVQQRMRSVQNIQKITKAMKMVAAAKFRRDFERKEIAEPFCAPVMNLMERLPVKEEQSGPLAVMALTSDKGLCGGVNSAVNKVVNKIVADEEAKQNAVDIWCVGGKSVSGLKLRLGDRFLKSFEEASRLPFTFVTASLIADRVISSSLPRFTLVTNLFRTMAAYDTKDLHVVTFKEAMEVDRAEWSKALDVYSFEPSIYEVFEDVNDFYIAATIMNSYLSSVAAEQSQRMAAMENASKNATDMLDKLTLMYNRARQAKITTELCEIISGASAV